MIRLPTNDLIEAMLKLKLRGFQDLKSSFTVCGVCVFRN